MTLQLMRRAGAVAILAVGAVHLQQYLGAGYHVLPTIGPLFLLNAIAAGLVGVGLLMPIERLFGERRGERILGLLALGAVAIAVGSLIALLALWGTWLIHKGRLDRSKWFLRAGLGAVVTPFVMNTAGWLLTESGRQPWIVQGLMKTVNANSPSVSSLDIWISLIAFVLVYIALGAADLILMLRYSRKGLDPDDDPEGTGSATQTPTPVMSY